MLQWVIIKITVLKNMIGKNGQAMAELIDLQHDFVLENSR